jgi:hypothetical protein
MSVARWIGIEQDCESVVPSAVNRLADASSPFLDDGREGAAQQRRLHLVGDAVELVANDFDRDGVEGFGLCLGRHGWFPPSAVMIRVPSAATIARQPGSIRVVVSGCSTIAGLESRGRSPSSTDRRRRRDEPAAFGGEMSRAPLGALSPCGRRAAAVAGRPTVQRWMLRMLTMRAAPSVLWP